MYNLAGNNHLLFCKFRQVLLLHGNTETEIDFKLLTYLIQLCQSICQILAFQVRNLQKAVHIHLLQVIILGNDSTYKTDKLITVFQRIILYINKPYLIVQLMHMLCALVKIYDIS